MRYVKQLIYGVFYLALWSGLIAGIYFWQRPAASCFDNQQNQGEAGVDCGGPCSRVCIPVAIKPIESVGAARLIVLDRPSSTPRADLEAQIQNRNTDFGASGFSYVFVVHDESGATIASVPGSSYIYPGEIKYLTAPNTALPVGVTPAYTELQLQEPQWSPAARFPRPELIVRTVNAIVANGQIVVQGTLANEDSVDFSTVEITAVFHDAAGAVVGISTSELGNVATGASRDYSLFHPLIATAALDRTEVFATAFNPR